MSFLRRGHLLALGLLASASSPAAALPCDIYASGGTPCVAAHSTVRALYSAYRGPLYQIKRSSDSTTRDISPVAAGGVAQSSLQDSFCSGTSCVISIIYDQSGHGNNLTEAPPGGAASGPAAGGYDNLANAVSAPVTLNGAKAYGVYVSPGTGYRNDNTNGVATGDQPEGIYAVFDGTHYNDQCCFDYGNAEKNNQDQHAGAMEAVYFGTSHAAGRGTGAGPGPWVKADLEDGLFPGGNITNNPNNPTITFQFVTAIVKGNSGNQWVIRGGSSASGSLATYYSGARPAGSNPMKKKGAIVLGVGGDNSDGGEGTFYEGAMTSGYPSDATENSVQANIVSAKYTSQ